MNARFGSSPQSLQRRALLGSAPGIALATMAVMLLASLVIACGVGAYPIAPSTIVRMLVQWIGFSVGDPIPVEQQSVIASIRLPRVILGALIGAGLGASGAAMQALFRNPLADPSLTGMSGGAALAAT